MSGPLRRLRDGLSLAQVGLALVGVALAGGVTGLSLVVFTILVALAWWRPLPAVATTASTRGWTALVFVALVATLLRAVLWAEFLDAGVDFLLLLVVQRMFNRQRAREHAQLLLLGTLLLVVGAVINTEPSYPLILAAYLLVATMALLVNNLVAEGERLGERVMRRLDHEAYRRRHALWRAAASVAALAAAGALATFLLFPRWGAGVFLRGGLPGETRSGFSDEVRLGGFGTIKTDTTVVMRIHPDHDPGTSRTTWHLRGSSFDRYDEGRWRHGHDAPRDPLRAVYGYNAVTDDGRARLVRPPLGRGLIRRPIAGFARAPQLASATILLEDNGVDALFVPSEPVAVRVDPRGALESQAHAVGGRNDEVRVSRAPGPVQYRALWRVADPTRAELESVGDPEVTPELARFLQRSPALSDELGVLARELAGDATTRLGRVEAVLEHLQGFDYTLDQPVSARVRAGADPIEGFLFDTHAGHCEYFATAMALLLRELHVPTRIVNGYYGGHRNEVGDFYAVRQADAHSWVEVHFGRLGWVTFDPTPPSGRTAGDDAPWWPAANELLDALRNAYLEYVIDYDLSKQLAILDRLGVRGDDHRPSGLGRYVLVGVLAFGAALWWLRRRRRREQEPLRPETRLMNRVLARLAAVGLPAGLDRSPDAIAERVEAAGCPGAAELRRFLRCYEALRFGPPAAAPDLRTLEAHARAAVAALARPPTPARDRA